MYSFAFQIDNGIPIIPFYNDKADEEMLHLVYYLNCLAGVQDVREQNRQAFELFKLSNGENLDQAPAEQLSEDALPESNYEEGDRHENQQNYEMNESPEN